MSVVVMPSRAIRSIIAPGLMLLAASAASLIYAQTPQGDTAKDASAPPAAESAKPAAVVQDAPPPPRPWPPPYAERRFDEDWRPIDWTQPRKGTRDMFDYIK